MKKKLKVTVVFDTDVPPPTDQDYSKHLEKQVDEAEFDVFHALVRCGHDVKLLGIHDDIHVLLDGLAKDPPDVVFNAAEAFRGLAALDTTVPTILDALTIPYTGCAPSGLIVARDKALSKKVLAYHGICVPRFEVYPIGREVTEPPGIPFPLLVKPQSEDASYGIAKTSIVNDMDALRERVSHVHNWLKRDVIAEELINGRELYVGVLGNEKLQVLPTVEMTFENKPNIATFKVKWDETYRERRGIRNVFPTDLTDEVESRLAEVASTAYRVLGLRDYGRIDVRLTPKNEIYVLEANPNPFIAFGEDFANAAEMAGLSYPQLLDRIVELAVARATPRNGKNGKKPSRTGEETASRPAADVT
ncbi:MAG: ATP-grasp domain-containing protein [Planctomycetes bacterium]|nr:ATP-grasp domain-containing protein [Planctomycetota bacterium]